MRGSTRFRLCRYKISGKPNVFEEFLTTRGYAGGYVIQAVQADKSVYIKGNEIDWFYDTTNMTQDVPQALFSIKLKNMQTNCSSDRPISGRVF